ncbi:hypothetical protein [Streptomyces sp. NPDC002758]
MLSRIHGRLLNPGEPWADRLPAELPALGAPWNALVEHARGARARRPTRTWGRRAPALAKPLGLDQVQRTVTPRLESAGEGGSRADGTYGPYNLHALVGFAWLLSLPEPDPASIRGPGSLVERPPKRTALTGAAVRALARLPRDLGRPELERLSAEGSASMRQASFS